MAQFDGIPRRDLHARLGKKIGVDTPVIRLGPASVYLGEKSGKYPDGNQVVVRGADTLAAFDTPLVANRLGGELLAAELVVLGHVHEDHMAGLHRLPGAEVHVHERDVEAARSWEGLSRHYGYSQPVLDEMHAMIQRDFHYVPRPDAQPYRDGAVWELGGGVTVRAFHAPGHTAGHCVLLVEPGGVAFIGDIELSSFGPYYGDATSNLADFRRTLEAVKEIPAQAWVTSHHKGVITDRATFLSLLRAFASRLDAREETIAAYLAETPATLEELVAHRFLYPKGSSGTWYDEAERRTIEQHLEALAGAGRAVQEDGCWRMC
jgi:glyoxylase-like metal-dependent hydrolase (beta-lactamase superfamily II)